MMLAQAPLGATVAIVSMTPSLASPQPLGTPVTWTITATDTNPNSLIFQFNVAFGSGSYTMVRDFNAGTLSSGVWTAQPFVWNTIAGEGTYNIEVIAKDFVSGETATQTFSYMLTPLATSTATVAGTANPLVALFSAPSCASGSAMRVAFYTGTNAPAYTNWTPCQAPESMNFYIAGMLPSTAYTMYSQVKTGGTITNGGNLTFTTGALPAQLQPGFSLPVLTVNTPAGPQTDTTDGLLLWGFTNKVVTTASDLGGNILWYYASGVNSVVTRPLAGGTMLTFQNGVSWNSSNQLLQMLREIDLAGNVVRETNTGALSAELTALGATDAASCAGVVVPAPVGASCLNDLSHDAIQFSFGGNQYTALLVHVEKVFPAGTQGSSPTGPPVDILSEMLVVLNAQWQAVWYYDSFQQLNLNRAAVLGEICYLGSTDCQTDLLLATSAQDWTHGNSIYYKASEGDFWVSLRNQDWLIKINYKNGTGAGNVLWRMGREGNFTFENVNNDPWPWFSHQHEAGMENNGAGPLTLFDNGNTRVSAPPLGLGKDCEPNDCDSRGMSLTVSETALTVTPLLSQSLGLYANSVGAAQLLSDGNYFFSAGAVLTQEMEIFPTPGTVNGVQVLNLSNPNPSYRGWQMPTLYDPPTT
jgi:hypothetical protein